jgi:diguanylate cyclase (GGDEF)-like protein
MAVTSAPHQAVDWWLVALLGGLVAVSENVALSFPSQLTVSPQLVLVMTALVATQGSELSLLIVGACGGFVLKRFASGSWDLVAGNLGEHALTAAAAATAYSQLPAGTVVEVRDVVGLGVYMALNYSLTVVGASLRSGHSLSEVWSNARTTIPSYIVFGVAGLLCGHLYLVVGPLALLVVIGPAIVARTVFTFAVRFRQAYHRLNHLYGFSRTLEMPKERDEFLDAALTEIRTLLYVGAAEIATVEEGGWRETARTGAGADTRERTLDPVLSEALRASVLSGPAATPDLDPRLQAAHRAVGYEQAMCAPLLVDGEITGVVTVARPLDHRRFDVEDLRMLETLAHHVAVRLDHTRLLERVRHDARHDPLTGLPNRTAFTDFITDTDGCAVLLADLDRFKEINDTLGHARGDLLLCSVAERMSAELGHKGIVAHLGGDEFGVLLPHTAGGDAAQAAVGLLSAIEQPFVVGELTLEIAASVGVATAAPGEDTSRLLQQADVAMYQAKAAHSGWEMYSAERDHYSPRRLTLATEMRGAIDSGELEVHFQPKADLTTGHVVGLEALVRWRHPHYGLLGPDVFVPLAEHVGLIRPLTLRVLQAAVNEQHRLRDLGFELNMAVNLSVRSVLDVSLPDQVAEVLESHGMLATDLTLEITEGSVMADPARTIGILGRLDALGVRISVDDFGTGYSSLSYLKRLPVSEIKIDRTFTSGMLSDESDATIVRSTVDLAHNLGLQVVAEGVEDPMTWRELGRLGCEQAQGFFVSAPLHPDALLPWLVRSEARVDPRR